MMKKILLVEDQAEIVMLFHVHISGTERALSVCSRGKDAINMAFDQYFDLIIIDDPLPDMPADRLCKSLTAQKVNSPILLITPGGDTSGMAAVSGCGADDWITRPFTIRRLKAKIRKLIRRSDDTQMALAGCE